MPPPPLPPALRPSHSSLGYPDSPMESARICLVWGWWLVGGGCLLALIPFLGFFAWLIASPLLLTSFVLAIISIAKGRTTGGLCLLLFSMFVAPFTLLIGPIISGLIGLAATIDPHPQPKLPTFLNSSAPWTARSAVPWAAPTSAPTAVPSTALKSAPTPEAEMETLRKEIQRQLNSKASLPL